MIERFDVHAPSDNPVYNLFRSEHRRRYQIAASWLGTSRPLTVVDAASGCGYGWEHFGYPHRYVGLDCSPEAVEACHRQYGGADFRVRDLDAKGAFNGLKPDAIVSLETAEHLRDPEGFLLRVRNALATGGRLVFSAPVSKTMDFDPYHKRDWSAERWAETLKRSGFTINFSESMPFTGRIWDLLRITPTTLAQKWSVARFNLTHPSYLADRLWRWVVKREFYWCSHIYGCVAS